MPSLKAHLLIRSQKAGTGVGNVLTCIVTYVEHPTER